jgi:small subunit ribosomal protein S13
MNKILGHSMPLNKPIYIALSNIYGIGYTTSKKILKTLNINIHSKISTLSKDKWYKLRKYILNIEDKLEENLKLQISLQIKKLQDIKCYRGSRHFNGLPLRGQRTKTNSRTSRKILVMKNKSLPHTNKL